MNEDEQLAALKERYHDQPPRENDSRDAYAHDKGRIIHASAFRRLQNKTQVSAPSEGDFHRTRLTHTLETAQIGEGIVESLRNRYGARGNAGNSFASLHRWLPSNDLIATACYCHDLGHPPFGHAGETQLQQLMHTAVLQNDLHNDPATQDAIRKFGGFEANAHTIRLLTRLEPYNYLSGAGGINPTRRTLLSVIKYPIAYSKYSDDDKQQGVVKCFFDSEQDIINWAAHIFSEDDRSRYLCTDYAPTTHNAVQKTHYFPTLDAAVMNCADEIAYSTHDVEDAIWRGFLREDDIHNCLQAVHAKIGSTEQQILKHEDIVRLFTNDEATRKKVVSNIIHALITHVEPMERRQFTHPLLRYSVILPETYQQLVDALRDVVMEKVILRNLQKMLEIRGKMMMRKLFNLYKTECRVIIPNYAQKFKQVNAIIANEYVARLRVITDFLANLSDVSLTKTYQMLFIPDYGSSTEEL